jgi:glucosyl-3-phosphoglycerate phosphatase
VSRRLVLLRHGRTAWNESGRAQGHADIELDELGHLQAKAAADHLAGLGLSRIWSSDLARARQTADYLASACGLAAAYDERLREFDVGERQGLTLDEFAARHPDEYASWVRGDGLVPVRGGEDSDDVERRIVPALRECLGALGRHHTGLVVTHGAAMKVAVAGLLGWPQTQSVTLKHVDNCAWVTLEEVDHGGRLRLVAYNQKAPQDGSVCERMGP